MIDAYLDAPYQITILSNDAQHIQKKDLSVIQNDDALPISTIEKYEGYLTVWLTRPVSLDYFTCIQYDSRMYPLMMGRYPMSIEFDLDYATEQQMGASYERSRTIFRVFAPTVIECRLILDGEPHQMEKIDGYFEKTINKDCHGRYYHYEASHNHVTHNIIDPYIKAVSANAKEAMVVDFERLMPGFGNHPVPDIPNDSAIIYETHVRDVTSHPNSGVRKEWRGLYLGMTQSTTTKHRLTSGLTYMKELGVTHVELMPVNDFATVDELNRETKYNWGYDPHFFMVPEGSYATDPSDPISRIIELQTLVRTLHENGMKVILDVVFNHVYQIEESSFEKLVPGYYFRHNADLSLSNGTGVGNDFATEKLMARRFITDTTAFWLDHYRIDGYRFDLMGALDIETMQGIEAIVEKQDRDIFLLGEGWDLPTALEYNKKTLPEHSYRVPSVHFFNDHYRDALKGSNFELSEKGYVNGDGQGIDTIRDLYMGYQRPFTAQMSINYVEVHDNHTLYDRLRYSSGKRQYILESQHQIATALVLLSFGTPFLHAGQEFFRTKYGHGNTYNLSDLLNRMDWNRRAKYQDNIEFVKSLIRFRKKEDVFRLKDRESIGRALSFMTFSNLPNGFGVRISYEGSEFMIIINPTEKSMELDFDASDSYEIELSNQRNYDKGVYNRSFYIKGYEVAILRKASDSKQ
ncbi:type I pullulanase [Salinicoccus sp. ID82-1]|uniref:Type I pullulanase n=1 Tax=Salinicoccus cyprini TaxID=2493691 RepID=A0A558AY11_9STAP|nr:MULTISPECIES: type I pullulanase [Salinicoccus]MCG1008663.1 type I pullulanase [Salinicoccus sp. ID82-1]TVT29140.1 type I pullulanase [Salinicoccus cyprini]